PSVVDVLLEERKKMDVEVGLIIFFYFFLYILFQSILYFV
ncbi:unnamed protein product, partial [marine sediment metagenome]